MLRGVPSSDLDRQDQEMEGESETGCKKPLGRIRAESWWTHIDLVYCPNEGEAPQ